MSEDSEDSLMGGDSEPFTGEFTKGLPKFKDVKGKGQITDEIAQFAFGTAVKYKLLPSVILSQYAYESEWGKSQSAKNDNNYFGITWFEGCPYPKGSARGVGGSEGGYYMKFPNAEEAFNYYGYMVASQENFNDSVGNKNPDEVLLTLGRGGYAAAGITKSSPYFTGAMSIIKNNNFLSYDGSAIQKWNSNKGTDSSNRENFDGEWVNPIPNTNLARSSFSGGQLFGTNSGGEFRQNGFHSGLDFGSVDHSGSKIVASHDGKVIYCGNPGIAGLGALVIVIDTGDYQLIYQEFATTGSKAKVKKGDVVKAGQHIADRDTEHLHFGVTQHDWFKALASSFSNNGVYKDPLLYLQNKK
nr:glucosaminidase domain-containing protein [Enterococcus faecalis]